MDGVTSEEAQRDQQQSATLQEAIRETALSLLKDTHTAMPGIVKSFNAATQTATVQPALQRVFRGLGPKDLPVCQDVPCCFPGGGGFTLTFPVAPGDEVLLVFSERAIDEWWDRGGTQKPSYRLHDLSDAVAILGLASKPAAIPGFNAGAAELRTRDGTWGISLFPTGQVTIKTPLGTFGNAALAEPFIKGLTFRAAQITLDAGMATQMGAAAAASVGPLAALQPMFTAMASLFTVFESTLFAAANGLTVNTKGS